MVRTENFKHSTSEIQSINSLKYVINCTVNILTKMHMEKEHNHGADPLQSTGYVSNDMKWQQKTPFLENVSLLKTVKVVMFGRLSLLTRC